ncbi:MAG: amino acid ABC transporter permease [Planctomycetota bacterium]|nr:MAG: amino acid ABC transporter permease [Planctomycetota bacterium]
MFAAFSPLSAQELDPALADRVRARLADGAIHWGGDDEGGAPYQFRDANDPNKVVGFEVDVMDAVARSLSKRLGTPIRAEFAKYEWVSLPQGLAKGDFDVIASGMEMTAENREKMRFSRPYYVYSQQLVVRADETRISALVDCRPLAVGTLSQSAAERILQEYGITRIQSFEGQTEPYRDLELGRIDAVLLDRPIAVYYAGANPRLKFVGERIGQGYYGLGMRHEDADLAAALDAALGDTMTSGELQRIFRKWKLWNEDQAALASRPNPAELAGLGFDAEGKPLDAQATGDDRTAGDIASESAKAWTFDRYAPLLVRAAGMTVFLSVASMALAMTLGLVICVLRLYGFAPLRCAALAYVEFFRGIPLLLLLTFLYFGLPELGVDIGAITAAILGFGLNYAAYEAEIYRSAIESVPRGQWEAGRALGMSEPLTFRRVVFPQAFRTALGPMTNDFVAMFKDTSLVSVIAVRELTKEYQILARSSLKYVELGLLTAALYLAMSVPLGYLSRYLEKRWGAGR